MNISQIPCAISLYSAIFKLHSRCAAWFFWTFSDSASKNSIEAVAAVDEPGMRYSPEQNKYNCRVATQYECKHSVFASPHTWELRGNYQAYPDKAKLIQSMLKVDDEVIIEVNQCLALDAAWIVY